MKYESLEIEELKPSRRHTVSVPHHGFLWMLKEVRRGDFDVRDLPSNVEHGDLLRVVTEVLGKRYWFEAHISITDAGSESEITFVKLLSTHMHGMPYVNRIAIEHSESVAVRKVFRLLRGRKSVDIKKIAELCGCDIARLALYFYVREDILMTDTGDKLLVTKVGDEDVGE